MKNYHLHYHLPSHLDRLYTASNKLNCLKIPRIAHFTNYSYSYFTFSRSPKLLAQNRQVTNNIIFLQYFQATPLEDPVELY